jgi:aminocarboxymuconate-semialdehyde decarboxylase
LIGAGVLDRYPRLDLLLAHGGGLLPWLSGRFDIMYERMDRAQQSYAAQGPPSTYLERLWYDTIVHEAEALRYLARRVGVARMLLGTDDPFPPMDKDPLGSLRSAGFDATDIARIADANPRALFRLLP